MHLPPSFQYAVSERFYWIAVADEHHLIVFSIAWIHCIIQKIAIVNICIQSSQQLPILEVVVSANIKYFRSENNI